VWLPRLYLLDIHPISPRLQEEYSQVDLCKFRDLDSSSHFRPDTERLGLDEGGQLQLTLGLDVEVVVQEHPSTVVTEIGFELLGSGGPAGIFGYGQNNRLNRSPGIGQTLRLGKPTAITMHLFHNSS